MKDRSDIWHNALDSDSLLYILRKPRACVLLLGAAVVALAGLGLHICIIPL